MGMDTVADFLTCIRNSAMAKHEKVDVPSSNLRVGLAQVLQKNGYIKAFKVVQDGSQGLMRIYLRYDKSGHHVISNIERVSKPSRRVYVKASKLKPIRSGFGLAILSTNKGILTDKEARDKNLGGEVLCKLW